MTGRHRKLVAAMMTGAMLSLGVVAFAPSASADTPKCVTRTEFQRVDFWDNKSHVHSVFDTIGHRAENDSYGETRQYRTCKGGSRSYVTVDYKFARQGVWFKWMFIESRATSGIKKCVTPEEFRKVRKGMTKQRVQTIFDTPGRMAAGGAGGYSQFYQQCKRPHRLVGIGFEVPPSGRERVYGKWHMQNP